jgi:hypothetical protein
MCTDLCLFHADKCNRAILVLQANNKASIPMVVGYIEEANNAVPT